MPVNHDLDFLLWTMKTSSMTGDELLLTRVLVGQMLDYALLGSGTKVFDGVERDLKIRYTALNQEISERGETSIRKQIADLEKRREELMAGNTELRDISKQIARLRELLPKTSSGV